MPRNSFLPSINVRENSFYSKNSENASRELDSTEDVLWKTPSLKFPPRPAADCWERRNRRLGEHNNEISLLLGHDGFITTFPKSDTSKTKRVIDIDEFVRNYVYIRENQTVSFKTSNSILLTRKDSTDFDRFSGKRKSKDTSFPPLEFTDEVIRCRGDPCLLSYNSTDMEDFYKLKGQRNSRKKKRKAKSRTSSRSMGFPPKHKLCMSSKKISEELSLPPKPSCSWKKELIEESIRPQPVKSTHIWEKYVLGLISKQTAQWIANQCCIGQQKSRLINFLDEKYEIENNAAEDGTATVYKLLSINDDAISPPMKKDKLIPTVD